MKRWCIGIAVVLLLTMVSGCGDSSSVTVYDAAGQVLAVIDTVDFEDSTLTDAGYGDYLRLALSEAVTALVQTDGVSEKRAARRLFSGGYELYTAFDGAVYAALRDTYEAQGEDSAFGSAVTDLKGALCAVYSGGGEGYCALPQSPHSAIKPLSVYAPAMDAGLIHWGTRLTDEPYKRIEGEGGRLTDWPSNATGKYSYEKESLAECVRYSLNTAAVHCLKDYGVSRSVEFLQNQLGVDLSAEVSRMEAGGEEEIIGNIALGSLVNGVTPVELAGYYQIFGNEGAYQRPYALTELRWQGKTVYTAVYAPRQIIKASTAGVMNHLLQEVTRRGATGEAAACEGLEVAGKTGTGDRSESNWFVGVTPEYSVALWHGPREGGNRAAQLFASVIERMPAHTQTAFSKVAGVHKGYFCKETGLLFTRKCSKIETGYYASEQTPTVCKGH